MDYKVTIEAKIYPLGCRCDASSRGYLLGCRTGKLVMWWCRVGEIRVSPIVWGCTFPAHHSFPLWLADHLLYNTTNPQAICHTQATQWPATRFQYPVIPPRKKRLRYSERWRRSFRRSHLEITSGTSSRYDSRCFNNIAP
jgi:hypothetical protein